MKQQAVNEILESGEFEQFKGQIESEEFEAKREPYRLDSDREKLELAKDVSALANVNGGVIVIGLRTTQVPHHLGDEVVKIRPFDSARIEADRYRKVIEAWTYPPISVEVKWYRSKSDPTKGLEALWVPQPSDAARPILMTHAAIGGRPGEVTELAVGLAVRTFGNVRPLTAQEIHARIQQGRIGELLSDIQTSLSDLSTQRDREKEEAAEYTRLQHLGRRTDELLGLAQLSQKPAYVLSMIPLDPIEIPQLFSDRFSDVVRLWKNHLNYGGMDSPSIPAQFQRSVRDVSVGHSILDGLLNYGEMDLSSSLEMGMMTIYAGHRDNEIPHSHYALIN